MTVLIDIPVAVERQSRRRGNHAGAQYSERILHRFSATLVSGKGEPAH